MSILVMRHIPDRSVRRVERLNPLSGQKELIDPQTGEPSGYPCLGIEFIDGPGRNRVDPPKETGISAKKALQLRKEGYLEMVNARAVTCPSGQKEDPWGDSPANYDFVLADEVHFLLGTNENRRRVRYEVTRSPGVYAVDGGGEILAGPLLGESRYDHEHVEVCHDFRMRLLEVTDA